MKTAVLLSPIAALLLACIAGCSDSADESELVSVSFVQILVNPEPILEYGQPISVFGYLTDFGGLKLYLSRDHAIAGDGASSVLVVDPTADATRNDESCLDIYVVIDGTLQRNVWGGLELVDIQGIFATRSGDQAGLWCYSVEAN